MLTTLFSWLSFGGLQKCIQLVQLVVTANLLQKSKMEKQGQKIATDIQFHWMRKDRIHALIFEGMKKWARIKE